MPANRLATKDELIPDTHEWEEIVMEFVARDTRVVFQIGTAWRCKVCSFTCIVRPLHGSEETRRCSASG